VNDPQKNDAQLTPKHETESPSLTQQPAELVELETTDLREVAGGGNGTVIGYD
jgi:hypothetical protein